MRSLQSTKFDRCKFYLNQLDTIFNQTSISVTDTSVIKICVIGLLINGMTKEEVLGYYPELDDYIDFIH